MQDGLVVQCLAGTPSKFCPHGTVRRYAETRNPAVAPQAFPGREGNSPPRRERQPATLSSPHEKEHWHDAKV